MSEQITPAVAAAVRVVSGRSLRELRRLILEVDPDLRVSPTSCWRWESGLTQPRPRHRRAWHRVIEQLLEDMEREP